jgi:hypothetical protein
VKRILYLQCAGRRLIHAGFKKPIGPAATPLCLVHRRVSVFQQCVDTVAVLRKQGNADAGRHLQRLTIGPCAFAHPVKHTFRHFFRVGRRREVLQQHDKLVATQPGNRVAAAHAME